MRTELGKLITGKFGNQIKVEYTQYVNVTIDEGEGVTGQVLLHEQGAVELIEQLQAALEEYRRGRGIEV